MLVLIFNGLLIDSVWPFTSTTSSSGGGSSNWNRGDEQTRVRPFEQRRLRFDDGGGGGTKSTNDHRDNNLDDSQELSYANDESLFPQPSPPQLSYSSNSIESSRSLVKQNMDNIARNLRTRTMNQVFQQDGQLDRSNDVQQQQQRDFDDDTTNDGSDKNIRMAVQSRRKYEFMPVHFDRHEMRTPRMIEIVSDTMPLRLHFKSQSAAIVVTQSHMSRKSLQLIRTRFGPCFRVHNSNGSHVVRTLLILFVLPLLTRF